MTTVGVNLTSELDFNIFDMLFTFTRFSDQTYSTINYPLARSPMMVVSGRVMSLFMMKSNELLSEASR